MALKIQADPTFWAKVEIPLPGGTTGEVKFQFNHMDAKELEAYSSDSTPVNDAKSVLRIARAWDNEEPFDEENIGKFLQQYHAAGRAIARKFVEELMQVRVGN